MFSGIVDMNETSHANRSGRTVVGPTRTGRGFAPTRHAERGFSLVELLFVLTIVGVMTSMVAPMFSPGRWRADGAAHEVVLGLNAAQRLAVLRQHDIQITFELSERLLRLHQDLDNDGVYEDGEDLRVVELPETMGFGAGVAPLITTDKGPITFATSSADPVLTFHRNGSASAAGIIYLYATDGAMAASAEAVRAVRVERATGEVRCFTYRTGSWEDGC